MSKGSVLVGMSGGVDSSVAAYLLKKQGYDVTGTLCYYWTEAPQPGEEVVQNKCCSIESQTLARRVCQMLDIPFYTMDLSRDFKKIVVDSFVKGFEEGETPNPCVTCNKHIKFGLFFEKAKRLGFDYLASGHYSKIVETNGKYALHKGIDPLKDQSYFLYNFNQEILQNVLFPLADLTKVEVRKIAEEIDLPSAKKKDSQGICFVKGKNHNSFLERHIPSPEPGPIFDQDGKEIGQHKGLPFYTNGQRGGIGVGGTGPYFVYRRDFRENALHVTNNPDDERMLSHGLKIRDYNWISGVSPEYPFDAEVKIRYMKKQFPVTVEKEEGGFIYMSFKQPLRAVMSGQSAVLFKGDEVLGGGVITE